MKYPTVSQEVHAHNMWLNGISFKTYFKILDAKGKSIAFEVGDYYEFCKAGEELAMQDFFEDDGYANSSVYGEGANI